MVEAERRDHPGDPASTRGYDGEHQPEETKAIWSEKKVCMSMQINSSLG